MSEQDKRLMSPDEVRERRESAFTRDVEALVDAWRKFIANAMLAGEYNCVTSTIVSAKRRRVLDAAREQLEKELQAAGWKSLCWREWSASYNHELNAFNRPGWAQGNCDQFGGETKYAQLMWSAG